MLFTGKFELSIDAQQRLAIPAKIRARLDKADAGSSLFVMPGTNGSLWIWPERTFERLAGEVPPSLTPAREDQAYDETTFPEAEQVELDNAGRIRIPRELIETAGLGSKVLLMGMRHKLELWDPQKWEEHRHALPPRQQLSDSALERRERGHRAT